MWILDWLSQEPQLSSNSRAPFPDPEGLEEFLVNLQWLEDEVSHIPITCVCAPRASEPYLYEELVDISHDLLQAIATVRKICKQDTYDAWKAFAPLVIQAVPQIRKVGIEGMLQDPKSWHPLHLSWNLGQVFRQFGLTLRDVGYKEEGDQLFEEHGRRFTSAKSNTRSKPAKTSTGIPSAPSDSAPPALPPSSYIEEHSARESSCNET